MKPRSGTFDKAVSRLLAQNVPGFRSLLGCRQLTAGASQETYRLEFDSEGGSRRLALRRCADSATGQSALVGPAPEAEARLLQLARDHRIPAPRIVHVLRPEDQLGRGFLMEWLQGETLGQRINRDAQFAEVRPRLARQCGQILGRIHSIDWRAAELDRWLPQRSPQQLLQETWDSYCQLRLPMPMIDYTWRWLQSHLPPTGQACLVHGDFRNGNLMVAPEGIVGVLDWELAQIGDPVRDLGWLCVNSWRFGQWQLPVGGFGEVDDLLSAYAETSGTEVAAGALHYWQVFGSFWWAVASLQMAQAWRDGQSPSLERPVIGRRSSEAQMDCVNLLIPGPLELPDDVIDDRHGTRLPMPAELLDGVIDFLQQDIADALGPREAFLAKVAANSLQIAQRELRHGKDLDGSEHLRLTKLLRQTGTLDQLRAELAQRLRSGLALDSPQLAAHLRQTVAAQCWVDQPHYSALQAAQAEASA